MRKVILYTLAMFLSNVGMAQQTASPQLKDGLFWGYYGSASEDAVGHYSFYDTYCLDGTVEKNGKLYYKSVFNRSFFDSSNSVNIPEGYTDMDSEGEILIRETDGRILVDREEYVSLMSDNFYWRWAGNKDYLPYHKTEEGELILYDFNMQPGDKYLSVEGYDDISIVSVNTLTTKDGTNRRLLTLSNGYKILEGVGCLNSPGMWLFYLNPGFSPYDIGFLHVFAYHPYPHDASEWDILYLYSEENNTRIDTTNLTGQSGDTIYDLLGRQVTCFSNQHMNSRKGLNIIKTKDGQTRKVLMR